jgi:putative membrane protein
VNSQLALLKSASNITSNPTYLPNNAWYPSMLLSIFIAVWCLLAIAPSYRQDWLLENVIVLIIVLLLIWGYRHLRLSNFSYTLIFIFLCLHEIGAHYTYSEVPVYVWIENITGYDVKAEYGIERNHYDRVIHFLYGFLMLPACVEIFQARARLVGIWQVIVPISFLMSHSELYELIEWQAAIIFGGSLGQSYLGTQGDIWDAQKDSFFAAFGAVSSMFIYKIVIKFRKRYDCIGDTPN